MQMGEVDQMNVQKSFEMLKNKIELKNKKLRYNSQTMFDLKSPIIQILANIEQKLKAITEQGQQENIIEKETETANVHCEIYNLPNQIRLGEYNCEIHQNQVIDRICLEKDCLQKVFCQSCEKNHWKPQEYIFTIYDFKQEEHSLNSVTIDKEIIQDYQSYFKSQLSYFQNQVLHLTPNLLILQNIDQSHSMIELQQKVKILSDQIFLGNENQITVLIKTNNDFYSCFQRQIQSLENSLSDYWINQREPQSEPLQIQFQKIKQYAN